MQRVTRPSAAASLRPAGQPGGARLTSPAATRCPGQAATVPGYEWFNAVQEELAAVATVLRRPAQCGLHHPGAPGH